MTLGRSGSGLITTKFDCGLEMLLEELIAPKPFRQLAVDFI